MNTTIDAEIVLETTLEILENKQETCGYHTSVPCLDFTETVGHGGCGFNNRCELIYRIGVADLTEQLNPEQTIKLIESAEHETHHVDQIFHKMNEEQLDNMIIDWLASQVGSIYYHTTLHQNSAEADAYLHAFKSARNIANKWFNQETVDTTSLKIYMDNAKNSDTIYFTKDKKSNYTNIEEYIQDCEEYLEYLLTNKQRPTINAKTLYKPTAKIANHPNIQVKDIASDTKDLWQIQLENTPKLTAYKRAFIHARNGLDQQKIAATFEHTMSQKRIDSLIPYANKINWNIKTPPIYRGLFP